MPADSPHHPSGGPIEVLDHPVDHSDDPTGAVWIRPDRRGLQGEQARSVWSRPDRRRAPGYGSGGWGSNPSRRAKVLVRAAACQWRAAPGGGANPGPLTSVASTACPSTGSPIVEVVRVD